MLCTRKLPVRCKGGIYNRLKNRIVFGKTIRRGEVESVFKEKSVVPKMREGKKIKTTIGEDILRRSHKGRSDVTTVQYKLKEYFTHAT